MRGIKGFLRFLVLSPACGGVEGNVGTDVPPQSAYGGSGGLADLLRGGKVISEYPALEAVVR